MSQKSNFIVRGGLDMSNFQTGMMKAQSQLGGFQTKMTKSFNTTQSNINKAATGIKSAIGTLAVAFGAITLGSLVKDSVKAAMTVESSMAQINRIMQNNAGTFTSWAKSQSRALGMAQEDTYKYGSVYGNLISGFESDTSKIGGYTTRLLQASAVTASATGRSVDDVMERIRSGILGNTESIEDLGVYANISMIQTTNAFKELANGKSWQQLDYNTQQQIRVMSILEQVNKKYGDTLANTTITRQNQFIATLKDIRLNIGNIVMPIYNMVLPALNSLASKVEAVTYNLSQLSQALFGKALVSAKSTDTQAQAMDGLADSTEKAAAAASKSTAAFDELNILNSSSKGGGGSSTAGAGTTGSTLNDNSATAQNAGLSKSFQDIKDTIEPVTTALKKLWDEGLSKVAAFSGKALKPLGKWVLCDGFPKFVEIINETLVNIDWAKINAALDNFWKALEPFAENVGEGLISFASSMADALTPALSTATDLLASGLNALAKAIGLIPEDVAKAIGGAIGGIATAALLFKGAAAVAGIITGIGAAVAGFVAAVSANPLLAIAAAFAAVQGAIIAFNKAKFDGTEVGKLITQISEGTKDIEAWNRETQTMLSDFNKKNEDITAEYAAVGILSDKYFSLANQQGRTNGENALLKSYAEELIEKVPELSGLIDAQTGAYKGTRDEIQACIDKSKEYYLVRAAEDSLVAIAKAQYEAEQNLAVQETARKDLVDKLSVATENYNATCLHDGPNKYYTEMKALQKQLKELDGGITTTKDTQKKLNSQWDYATDYITTYSSATQTAMSAVPTAVQTALDAAKKSVKNFKLPKLMIDIGINESIQKFKLNDNEVTMHIMPSGYAYPDIKQYATGGLPNIGQMFVARESGPELVGRIGNGSAVANNDQIVSSVSQGVASAVASVLVPMLSSRQSGGDIVLVVNDREIARAVNTGNTSLGGRYNPILV